ncbi:MAG: class I SAM-dependent methyltransferase [Hyphomicrobiales bacterium]
MTKPEKPERDILIRFLSDASLTDAAPLQVLEPCCLVRLCLDLEAPGHHWPCKLKCTQRQRHGLDGRHGETWSALLKALPSTDRLVAIDISTGMVKSALERRQKMHASLVEVREANILEADLPIAGSRLCDMHIWPEDI